MKKVFSMLLAVSVLLTLFSLVPFAATANKTYLTDMEYFVLKDGGTYGSGIYKNEYKVDNFNNKYESSLYLKEGSVSYLLKKNYKRFTGTVACPKGIEYDSFRTSATVTIYGDDKVLYTSKESTVESKPQLVDIDVSNVEILKIEWKSQGANIWSNWGYLATLFNGGFTAQDGLEPKSTPASSGSNNNIYYFTDMEYFVLKDGGTYGSGIYKNEKLVDNFNNTYQSSLYLKEGSVSYLLKKNYKRATGTIACPKGIEYDSFRTSATVIIYGDDKVLYTSKESTVESKPQLVDIDVSNVEILKIEWKSQGANIWSNWGYLATLFNGGVIPRDGFSPKPLPPHSPAMGPELEEAQKAGLIPKSLEDKDLTQKIDRAEFAAVAVQLFDVLSSTTTSTPSSCPFTDIRNNENEDSIKKAYKLNITTGTSKSLFSPDDYITREQLATMLCRALKKYAFSGWSIANDSQYYLSVGTVQKFEDDYEISDYARDSVYFMSKFRVIKGVGNNMFAPKGTSTRGEALDYGMATREQAIVMAKRILPIKDVIGD